MTHILFHKLNRAVLGYGYLPFQPEDINLQIVLVSDALLAQLQLPGTKEYRLDGTILVTPPDPPPVLPSPNYGADTIPLDQALTAVSNLRAYLALDTPTNAQTLAALKLTIRVVLHLLRRFLP